MVHPTDRAEIIYNVRSKYHVLTGEQLGKLRIKPGTMATEGDALIGFYTRHFLSVAESGNAAKKEFLQYINWAFDSWASWDKRTRANLFGTLTSQKMLERYLGK